MNISYKMITPRAWTRGKVIGSVVVVSTKITKSQVIGTGQCSMSPNRWKSHFKLLRTTHELYKVCVSLAMPIDHAHQCHVLVLFSLRSKTGKGCWVINTLLIDTAAHAGHQAKYTTLLLQQQCLHGTQDICSRRALVTAWYCVSKLSSFQKWKAIMILEFSTSFSYYYNKYKIISNETVSRDDGAKSTQTRILASSSVGIIQIAPYIFSQQLRSNSMKPFPVNGWAAWHHHMQCWGA